MPNDKRPKAIARVAKKRSKPLTAVAEDGTIADLRAYTQNVAVLIPVKAAPWFGEEALHVDYNQPTLKAGLQASKRRDLILIVHKKACVYAVSMFPRKPDGLNDDTEEMCDAMEMMHATCMCHPTILYTGATA